MCVCKKKKKKKKKRRRRGGVYIPKDTASCDAEKVTLGAVNSGCVFTSHSLINVIVLNVSIRSI